MKIVVCGNYGAGNLGDEMILTGLLALLNDVYPNSQITVLGKDLPKFPSGFRSFFQPFKKTREAVKNCDLFILGGGGLFAGPEPRANLIWGIQALWAYHYKKPVIMLGQSLGPTTSNFIKRIFKKASFIAVRDQDSKTNLQTLGITKEIYVTPDLAFYTPTQIPQTRKKEVLVALRQMPNLPSDFILSIANFLDSKISEGWSVKMINFQTGSDEQLHNAVIAQMKNSSSVTFLSNLSTFNSSFILGMRLHSVIFAIKTNTPFLAINYAPKVEGILKDLKLENHLINLNELNKLAINQEDFSSKIPDKRLFLTISAAFIKLSNDSPQSPQKPLSSS